MSIKPILFSTPMVQAILAGRKSMTRRIVSADIVNAFDICLVDGPIAVIDGNGDHHEPTAASRIQVGDILWVRETWCELWKLDWNDQIIEGTEAFYYAADGYNPTPFNAFPDADGFNGDRNCPKWRPSIYMPKEACRLFLRVTGVRAERLQDITATDAVHEGIARHGLHNAECLAGGCYNGDFQTACAVCEVPREGFRVLWDSLNAKRGYGWDANPWVWVYTFESCDRPEGWPS